MTHHTDAARAEFEAWARGYGTWEVKRDDDVVLGTTGYTDITLTVAWHAVQAAHRAPAAPVPQGWKLVPEWPTVEMSVAGDDVYREDGPEVFSSNTIYTRMLAAAPQPPEHMTSEHSKPMCGAAPKVDPIAWYVTGCSTMLDEHDAKAEAKRCGGCAQAVPLYAAPQPPEAGCSVSNGETKAAPVQLPEPVAVMTDTTPREPGWKTMFVPNSGTRLYTEHQVRQLLAAHGIKEQST